MDEQTDKVEKRGIERELQECYLDYAMSVIISRALPDVRDGMKPVQRRILWAMWETGLKAGVKYRKSAAVVGEVLKSYHPHGDSAVYDAMARMAQDFSLRYPLIDGQGNWGSIDGDNQAAMRYTECRLSKISEELLFDIEKDTVAWGANYDGTSQEPLVLPARLPALLLNGVAGIAVGMATNIPPHNLREIVDAILHLSENPHASTDDLIQFIKGPDFPTGGIIYDKHAIAEAYKTGRGGVTMRAVSDIHERKSGLFNIVITEIPYQVNKSELLAKIAGLVTEKKIEGIKDLRDESDRDGLRVVVELKNDAAPQKVLNQLYKHTDLQKNFNFNMTALVPSPAGLQPQLLSLKDILGFYLEHRKEVVRKRAEYELRKAQERAHILEGLAKALEFIDAVIATIKKSKDKEEAHENLIKKFKLTPIQTTAILEMRLQTLAALESKKIEDELKEKMRIIKELQTLLASVAKILGVITNELRDLRDKFGDDRRTKVVPGAIGEFKEIDLIPEEDVIITLSQSGYIKRVTADTYKAQKRGGKGLIGSEVNEEDTLVNFISGNTHDNILFFTHTGRVFQTKVYDVPQGSRTAKGKLMQNFLDLPPEEKINAVIAYPDGGVEGRYLVMLTADGTIKKTSLSEFANIRRTGIIAINLAKGDSLIGVKLSSGKDEIIITTNAGQAIRFKETDAKPLGRAAAGVRGIKLKKEDRVAGFDIVQYDEKTEHKKQTLLVVSENGFAKQTPISEYKTQTRGGMGIKTSNVTPKIGNIISGQIIRDEEELLAVSNKGQIIRIPLKDVRTAGRATSGVKIMSLKEKDKLAGVVAL
ncbi:DNA gyrase subunit A [Candidatus Wolfebacteria bacterium RIFOXYD12_FULL_48_21]|uniref:DNA gyrase subunit A n=1 Tax=Candidatus Wolfebacteria bacterium RIFOXYD1_FULL_48_65 TaxID=1802561 RepID=A0A1F8E0U3_9BACT|nr:MAG: DNA gyrase subunit A [Candidatus Wolfebacteria bacterium RIFOXYD1_FULL_48_65]OGM95129.1 MAG: DNA gyrase subunit A [Candidatus Wolfebacteria bacterium RIFOXYD12_FULL_48_21]